jgi:uncharacterized protein YdeI (YjbR/CyaY-like superfamily)
MPGLDPGIQFRLSLGCLVKPGSEESGSEATMPQRPYSRERYPMPEDVAERLREAGLSEAYEARPPYQRNDYLMWIGQAKRDETREKRIAQMLDELKRGGIYMKMAWDPGD